MKNKILAIVAAASISATICSCREESTELVSFGQNDYLNFSEADTCFVGQFKGVWTALNCNYALWDFEEKQGLDWDAVYDKYLPKMKEFDERDAEENGVSDEELQSVYEEMLSPLHDGHILIEVRNLHTGTYLQISPSYIRNSDRPDNVSVRLPVLSFYHTADAGENQITEYDTVTVRPSQYSKMEIEKALALIDQRINELQAKPDRNAVDDYIIDCYNNARNELSGFSITTYDDVLYYNDTLTRKYEYLGITLNTFDIDMADWLDLKYATFDDGIAYLYISGFSIFPYINGWVGGTPCSDTLATQVYQVIEKWIDRVQEMHNAGQLKGVIIDVRNNGGGYTYDYQFLLGSLLPSGGHEIAYNRFKTGVGRYDYSPLTPFVLPTLVDEHQTITEPIIVLANTNSVSMAEMTCLGAKQVPNAHVIGTQTWGALSTLIDAPEYYSLAYSSCVGISGETPFYAYIPFDVTVTKDLDIIEGTGIIPDIEVTLDVDLLNNTGRDNQLERALQYIRTGK